MVGKGENDFLPILKCFQEAKGLLLKITKKFDCLEKGKAIIFDYFSKHLKPIQNGDKKQ